MFSYIPKKSKEIYKEKIAHRGFHFSFPENTLPAYIEAINKNLAIEIDIRMTKDGHIICLHDKYTKRLLGKKGKTANYTFKDICKYNVLNSEEKIPTLKDVLDLTESKTILLIEVKGYLTNEFKQKLLEELKNYSGTIYFHAQNLITYYKLKSIFKDKVFWVLNPFRKRFDFIKFKSYRKMVKD